MAIFKKSELEVIEKEMYNKARDIDVAIYNALFSNMPLMFVSTALSGYQNKDGGFAHALEIDNYNKDSSVYQVYEALRIVCECGFTNMNEDEVLKDLLKKTFNYLYNKLDNWCPLIPSNDNAVCASWFKYNESNIELFGDAPEPAILGYTLFLCDNKSPYYKMAIKRVEKVIDKYFLKSSFTKEEFLSYKILYNCLKERNLYVNILDEYKKKLIDYAKSIVERDEGKFNTYCNLPLEMFDEYTNIKEIDELIDKNLDYIINNRPSHGLWEANFDWKNDYPEASTAQIKWMGPITIRNLLWLKKFNRIEE